jgi:HTH-type transcriptional regulator/antitoxin HigA
LKRQPRLLQESGVRLVVVEKLSGGKIDGVCLWLKNSPVIGMLLRHDRIDNFWFVLRHEIEHVLRKHGQAAAIIDVDIEAPDDSTTHEKSLANLAAAEFCVAQNKLSSYYSRKNLFSQRERYTIAFARHMEVHPGIVVGQIQRRTERRDFLRRHQVKIHKHLGLAMHMDG